jgi:hypothetical protein
MDSIKAVHQANFWQTSDCQVELEEASLSSQAASIPTAECSSRSAVHIIVVRDVAYVLADAYHQHQTSRALAGVLKRRQLLREQARPSKLELSSAQLKYQTWVHHRL